MENVGNILCTQKKILNVHFPLAELNMLEGLKLPKKVRPKKNLKRRKKLKKKKLKKLKKNLKRKKNLSKCGRMIVEKESKVKIEDKDIETVTLDEILGVQTVVIAEAK